MRYWGEGNALCLVGAITLALFAHSHHASAQVFDWKPSHTTRFYDVSGQSGIEIYRDIGQKGPSVGIRRAIGLTEWDLKWQRNYVPENDSCRLTAVRPFLAITTTLPRSRSIRSTDLARKWARFEKGIAVHEQGHSDRLYAVVDDIIARTSELVVFDDPQCREIRAEVQRRVKAAFDRYQADNTAYERREMSNGGNVQQLILELVN
ncbi:MAG: DUF922 domain-containing protein [Pseudomonadota bacterium]